MDLKKYIVSIPDFPAKGVIFKDITPLMLDGEVFHRTIVEMAAQIAESKPNKIAAPEARGFLFGPAIANELRLPFMPIRKPNKLPRETVNVKYDLEYGTNTVCAHREDIFKTDRFAIVDDVLATGGTADAMCKIVGQCGASVACLSFFMELTFLHGAEKLNGYKVYSLIKE